ncbi:DNA polymerase/3'-5' exonuclease PolX [Sediminibacterium soli]|uniref:DNA polymerase/3'-5' exonuclease PolX n=1 Tax=Sediminibacterium soli TaxID=2698829 RepID=UPI00137A7533|nr:DNA polymerase/3'-5' exonuclease PolX [Sediminibacterium soli]NCI46560.1 DNA polymerase/3'-5' exonuclease PolX [Sediminibacterium soli]
MDNYTISENFSLLSKLMDIHGDNSFKAKSYASAAFTIDRLTTPLAELAPDKIAAIKGIGESVAAKIREQLATGELGALKEYLLKTPAGVLEMLHIKGIGPKKIATIWKELEIESLGELLYACNENRLTLYKGFGEKTQNNIREAIEFYMNNQGSYLYRQVAENTAAWTDMLHRLFANERFEITGEFRRQMEVINKLEWVTTAGMQTLKDKFETPAPASGKETTGENLFEVVTEENGYLLVKGQSAGQHISFGFYTSTADQFCATLFRTSCSAEFLETWIAEHHALDGQYATEDMIFAQAGLPLIPVYLRETAATLLSAKKQPLPEVIQPEDITGIIHCHSNWSDGADDLAAMAKAAKQKGLQFLVISDHSKTAFYANGLSEERILAQHRQVDELNKQLAPFKLFKSIESDILNDGSLDYAPEILSSFDIVIASVHSNLKMNEEKAMMRLLKAIENPYTSILGHMTGRLLLSRNGYPVDHAKIIDACAANDVVIELNAHPRRLDIDWRYIAYALEKNVLISIDPDAHAVEGFDDCRYGVLAAQKAGLTREQNLSSFSLKDFEAFVARQHRKR